MPQFVITEEHNGLRLDVFLSQHAEISRNSAALLCENGEALVNGKQIAKNHKLKTADIVEYTLPEPVKLDAFPQEIPIDIVYEDQHLLVVNKPRGMVVHPAAGNLDGTLVNAVLYHCQGKLSSINGVIRPGIVHRIDKDTSGLLVIAKDDKTHEGLSTQFAEHSVNRLYYAVAHGNFKDDEGRIEAPIGRHINDRKKMCVTAKNARFAATNYKVLERFKGFTLLQLKLETGRTHQIRVHLAYINHQVAGDLVYGNQKVVTELNGQCLHAAVLGFVHPITKEYLSFEAPLPDYFENFLTKLRGRM